MGSGRQPSRVRRRCVAGRDGAAATGRGAVFALLAACVSLCAASLSSCAKGPATFLEARSSLDRALEGRGPAVSGPAARKAAFAAAYKLASSSADWLSLLKRAQAAEAAGDAGRIAEAAGRALRSMSGSEPVARAAAHLYLRSGAPEKALALFAGALSAQDHPDLWAEAYIQTMKAGSLPSGDHTAERLDLLANAAGEPNFLVDAALLSLASGDRFGAGARLSLAIDRGANPGSELLWDAGLYELLAARPDQGAGPAELRLLGDAAYLAGKSDLAERRWQAALERDPAGSWKTYASLGALAAERAARRARESAAARRPSSEVDSWAEIGVGFDPGGREASPGEKPAGGLASGEERRVYERLLAAFPADGEAKAAYASFLVRDGREAEAAALLGQDDPAGLGSRGARAKLAAESLIQPEERVVALAISLAALRADDGDFLAEAMRLLLARRRWADFLALRDSAAARGLSYPTSWYYDAIAAALRGDGPAAVGLLEKEGPANPGPEAALALGLLYSREGELELAESRLEVAGDAARDGKELCAVLKARGFLFRKSGDAARARAAFNAAAAADPDDAEAKILARTP